MDERIEPETDSQRIALHRVLREALTNVNKHAGASHVTVRLYEQDDVIYLQVSDDGVGFDPVVARGRSDSLGLNGMYERLRLLGSELSVDSRPAGRRPSPPPSAGGGLPECAGDDPVAVVLGMRRRRTAWLLVAPHTSSPSPHGSKSDPSPADRPAR